MNFEISFEYPFYFITFCLLAGVIYAGLAYYKSFYTRQKAFFEFPNLIMAFLRFLAVSLIAFLLLSPFIKDYFKKIEQPAVVVGMDNSKSITLNRDSSFYKDSFPAMLENTIRELSNDFEVAPFTFGENVSDGMGVNYEEQKTNLGEMLDVVYDRYYNRNLGAVVLGSDGIFNEGRNPLTLARKIDAPVYTVALGDTIPPKDVGIERLRHNEIVYANDRFPVEVDVKAKAFKSEQTKLIITTAGREVFSETVEIGEDPFNKTVKAYLEAEEPGVKRYKVRLQPLEGEINEVNNSREMFVEVLESKKEILIAGNSPHPDIAAIKRAIESNERYEVTTTLPDHFYSEMAPEDRELEKYNLVILHQIPGSNRQGHQLVKEVMDKEIPVWFITGPQTQTGALNRLPAGIQIKGGGNRLNEVLPNLQSNFKLFSINDDLKDLFKELPPLKTLDGEYEINGDHSVFLRQKIGDVESERPLLAFIRKSGQKVGVFNGTDIWRWGISEYRLNEEQEGFEQLINKSVQYLSVQEDKRRFRLRNPDNIFYEDEKVSFEAELYNESYESYEGADITMEINDQSGKTYNFDFHEIENGYRVDAGYLPVGSYEFTASTNIEEETFTLSGEFIVKPVDQEYRSTVANHQLLYTLAEENGGQMISPADIEKLPEILKRRHQIEPVARMEYRLKELIHNKWLFFVILAFLSMEWFFRKFFGGY